jgi:hypothetical protein
MEKQRNEDAEDLDEDQVRHVVYVLNVLVEAPGSVHRRRVRVHVDEEKHAQRHDTGQLVQLPQQESVAEFYRHGTQFRVRDSSQAFVCRKKL